MKRLLGALAFAALAACATAPTRYGPAATADATGYREQRLEQERYRVSFRANPDLKGAQVEDMVLKFAPNGVSYVGDGELARICKIAHNVMLGVVIQNLIEITLLANKMGAYVASVSGATPPLPPEILALARG